MGAVRSIRSQNMFSRLSVQHRTALWWLATALGADTQGSRVSLAAGDCVTQRHVSHRDNSLGEREHLELLRHGVLLGD